MSLHNQIGIPIIFDYHHHKFCTGDLTEQQALELAISTWPEGIVPAVHYSESAVGKKPQAHSDYIFETINTYGNELDIMVEAKQKDLTILKYLKEHNENFNYRSSGVIG